MSQTPPTVEPVFVILRVADGQFKAVEWDVFQSLIAPKRKRPQVRPDGLKAAFIRELSDGPRKVSDIRPVLLERWGPDRIKTVRLELGVVSTHLGGLEWTWSLPPKPTKPTP